MDNIKEFTVSFVRHAESKGNVGLPFEHEFHKDNSPLSEYGHIQADALSGCDMILSADKIFCSPLIRAIQTIYPSAQKTDKNIILLPDLLEFNTSIVGTEIDFLRKNYPLCSEYDTLASVRNETFSDLCRRAEGFVDYIYDSAADGENIVVVTHGTYLTFLLKAALGISSSDGFTFQVDNCSVTRVIYRKNYAPKLSFANYTEHLKSIDKGGIINGKMS